MQMLLPLHPQLTNMSQNCQGYLILFIQCLVLTTNHTYQYMQKKKKMKAIRKPLQTVVDFDCQGKCWEFCVVPYGVHNFQSPY